LNFNKTGELKFKQIREELIDFNKVNKSNFNKVYKTSISRFRNLIPMVNSMKAINLTPTRYGNQILAQNLTKLWNLISTRNSIKKKNPI
jgi:hypothetical protein